MPQLDVTQASVAVGILCTGIVLVITIARQKRLDLSDLGTFIGAFFSGLNIPPAIFLCLYVFMSDPELNNTLLREHKKYISVAGLVLFLASIIGVWTFCKTAWKTAEEETSEVVEPAEPAEG
jgi:hypothetical protein